MKQEKEKALFTLWIIFSLPGILRATCSTKRKSFSNDIDSSVIFRRIAETNCFHGYCTEDGSCECNPCWSGPTCEEYIDRFAPRFLAEEPFFIHDIGVVKPPNFSISPTGCSQSCNDKLPLFRIESSDDDLGLTCQLGQVGPAATCPCATPRYSVVGSSKFMFYTDEETGDVFLRDGFLLEPSRHYFIRLQVKALQVNSSFYKPWTSQVVATLYIRSAQNGNFEKLETDLHLYIDSYNGNDKSTESRKRYNIIHTGESEVVDNLSESEEESDEEADSNPRALPLLKGFMGSAAPDFTAFRYKRQVETESLAQSSSLSSSALNHHHHHLPHVPLSPPQIPNVKVPDVKIYFHSTKPTLSLGEKVKIDVFIQVLSTINQAGDDSLFNFNLQISSHPNIIKHSGVEADNGLAILGVICNGSIAQIGSHISYSFDSTLVSPILKSNGNLPVPNQILWKWRNVSSSAAANSQPCDADTNEKCSYKEIKIELYICTFAICETLLKTKTQQHNSSKPMVRLDGHLEFLTNEKVELTTTNEVVDESDEPMTGSMHTFIEIPVNPESVNSSSASSENKLSSFNRPTRNKINVNTACRVLVKLQEQPSSPEIFHKHASSSIVIKVYLTQPTTSNLQIILSLAGNSSQTLFSIQDLRLVKAGDLVLACCPMNILRDGFKVECNKSTSSSNKSSSLSSATGTSHSDTSTTFEQNVCIISSRMVNLCCSDSAELLAGGGGEGKEDEKEDKTQKKLMMMMVSDDKELMRKEDEEKVLEFHAVIHSSFQSTTSDSQFVVETHLVVVADEEQEKGHQRPQDNNDDDDTSSSLLLLLLEKTRNEFIPDGGESSTSNDDVQSLRNDNKHSPADTRLVGKLEVSATVRHEPSI